MKITGTFHDGKTYRDEESGRWARVMVTKLSFKTIIVCALGDKGSYSAFEVFNCEKQCHAAQSAKNWVAKAWL